MLSNRGSLPEANLPILNNELNNWTERWGTFHDKRIGAPGILPITSFHSLWSWANLILIDEEERKQYRTS